LCFQIKLKKIFSNNKYTQFPRLLKKLLYKTKKEHAASVPYRQSGVALRGKTPFFFCKTVQVVVGSFLPSFFSKKRG